jgi:hypothetical protein
MTGSGAPTSDGSLMSSGVPDLDDLLGGLVPGDNVV